MMTQRLYLTQKEAIQDYQKIKVKFLFKMQTICD